MKAIDRFKQGMLKKYFLRFHMSLMLMAVVASGMLASKALLEIGLHSPLLRYPLATLVSYGVFVGLVRLWISYICGRWNFGLDSLGDLNTSSSSGGGNWGGSGGGGGVRFGGGSSGGGGASDNWAAALSESEAAAPIPTTTSSSSGGGSWSLGGLGDISLDGDDVWILILLAVLVLAICLSGGYLIWAAPNILPDVAVQAVIIPTLARKAKKMESRGWVEGLIKSTILPFLAVLLITVILGWAVHSACPQASRLMEALNCAN